MRIYESAFHLSESPSLVGMDATVVQINMTDFPKPSKKVKKSETVALVLRLPSRVGLRPTPIRRG